jgi:hypothetical protein
VSRPRSSFGAAFAPPMNNITATDDAPVPFPTKEERDALILEFQRLAARLTRAGLAVPSR